MAFRSRMHNVIWHYNAIGNRTVYYEPYTNSTLYQYRVLLRYLRVSGDLVVARTTNKLTQIKVSSGHWYLGIKGIYFSRKA